MDAFHGTSEPVERRLREAIERIANQLCRTVSGGFDAPVRAESDDEALQKLEMLINFVLDAARRGVAAVQTQNNETHSRMRAIVDAAPDGIVTVDERGVIESFNHAACRIFGYSGEEAIGMECRMLAPPEQREQFDLLLSKCLETETGDGVTLQGETVWLRKNGSTFPMEFCVSAVQLADRRVLVAIVRDVTERELARRRNEQTLERQARVNRLLQDQLLGLGSLDEKLQAITDTVVAAFDADFCRIWVTAVGDRCDAGCVHAPVAEGPHVCRQRDRCLHLRASSGRYTHLDGETHRRVPFGCYKIGRVAAADEPKFLTNDAAHDPRVHNHAWAQSLGLVSFAGYRLITTGGEPIGVLALFSKHAISAEDDGLLESVAAGCSHVIQTARAEQRLREHLAQLDELVNERTAELSQANRRLEREIADRCFAEEAARDSEQYVQTVLDTIGAGVFVIDAESHDVVDVNDCALAMIGVSKAEAVGSVCHKYICPAERGQCPITDLGQTRDLREDVLRRADGETVPVLKSVTTVARWGRTYLVESVVDLSERKKAEAQLAALHDELLQASRQAGMAELATDVLHNVGNVLNSVNVSTTLLSDKLLKSRISRLADASALMSAHTDDLAAFLTADEKGKRLPAYLARLAQQLDDEQNAMLNEVKTLITSVQHIKDIVSAQQSHAGACGVVQSTSLAGVLDDALTVTARSFHRYGIELVREYADLPPVAIDKQRLLQIMVNLIRNAKHAALDGQSADRRLTVRMIRLGGDRVQIDVIDNGVGIPPENLTRIFTHGFTTKKDGHGFGLHSSALAAKELGGSLTVHSAGPQRGATFTLVIPLAPAAVGQSVSFPMPAAASPTGVTA